MSDVASRRGRISAGIGGTLALEFTNTAGWHLAEAPSERLCHWRDFVTWAGEQGLIGRNEVDALASNAVPMDAVISLREAVFRTGVAAVRGEAPTRSDLAAIIAAASVALPQAAWRDKRLRFTIEASAADRQLLGVIARDALDLLTGDRVARLKLCEGGECGWLFLDDSRGKPRRWCSMADCGNRAKAHASYRRGKAKRVATT